MNKKYPTRAAAVIEIGSDSVKMQVSELKKGALSLLDLLEYPVHLGRDVFETGGISFESLRELSGVLQKFYSALLSYGIECPKVISSAALREAKNRALVSDQLKVRNGAEVSVLEESEERALLCFETIKQLEGLKQLSDGYSLIACVGSGSVGLTVYDGRKVVFSQNIPIGTLKLHDLVSRLYRETDDSPFVAEEYLDTLFSRVHLPEFPIESLIFTGSEMDKLYRLCGAKEENGRYWISRNKLSSLYQAVRPMTAEGIAQRYEIPLDNASLLYFALAIYHGLLRFQPKAERILSVKSELSQAVAREQLTPKSAGDLKLWLAEGARASAEVLAQRFGVDLSHAKRVSSFACKTFDKLKKIHGLGFSERITLELASLLHSCGSFINAGSHDRCTYDLIREMDLFGLTRAQIKEVAFVAGSISGSPDLEENLDLSLLPEEKQIVVSKLSAIFRAANALDKSHQGKLSGLRISLEEDRVLFSALTSHSNCLLEKWAFGEASGFFRKAFGLSPELSVKFQLAS